MKPSRQIWAQNICNDTPRCSSKNNDINNDILDQLHPEHPAILENLYAIQA